MRERELQQLGLYQIGNSFVQISAQSPDDLCAAQRILQNPKSYGPIDSAMEKIDRLLKSNNIILSELKGDARDSARDSRTAINKCEPQKKDYILAQSSGGSQRQSEHVSDSKKLEHRVHNKSSACCDSFASSITKHQLDALDELDTPTQDSEQFPDESQNSFKQVLDLFYSNNQFNQCNCPIVVGKKHQLADGAQQLRHVTSIRETLFKDKDQVSQKQQQSIEECLNASRSCAQRSQPRLPQQRHYYYPADRQQNVYQSILLRRAGEANSNYTETKITQSIYEQSLQNNKDIAERIKTSTLLTANDFQKLAESHPKQQQPETQSTLPLLEQKKAEPERRPEIPAQKQVTEAPKPIPAPQALQVKEPNALPPPPPLPSSPSQLPSLKPPPPPPLNQPPTSVIPPPPPPPPSSAQQSCKAPLPPKKVEPIKKQPEEKAPEPGSLQEMIQQQIKKMKAKRGEV